MIQYTHTHLLGEIILVKIYYALKFLYRSKLVIPPGTLSINKLPLDVKDF